MTNLLEIHLSKTLRINQEKHPTEIHVFMSNRVIYSRHKTNYSNKVVRNYYDPFAIVRK